MHERAIWQLYKVHNNMRNRKTSNLKQPQTSSELTTFSPLVSLRLSTWELSTKTERASEVNLQFWLEGKLVLKLKEMRKCHLFLFITFFSVSLSWKIPLVAVPDHSNENSEEERLSLQENWAIPTLFFPTVLCTFLSYHCVLRTSYCCKSEVAQRNFLTRGTDEQPEGKRK